MLSNFKFIRKIILLLLISFISTSFMLAQGDGPRAHLF